MTGWMTDWPWMTDWDDWLGGGRVSEWVIAYRRTARVSRMSTRTAPAEGTRTRRLLGDTCFLAVGGAATPRGCQTALVPLPHRPWFGIVVQPVECSEVMSVMSRAVGQAWQDWDWYGDWYWHWYAKNDAGAMRKIGSKW